MGPRGQARLVAELRSKLVQAQIRNTFDMREKSALRAELAEAKDAINRMGYAYVDGMKLGRDQAELVYRAELVEMAGYRDFWKDAYRRTSEHCPIESCTCRGTEEHQ